MSEHEPATVVPTSNPILAKPTSASARIESLDVLRGFALLGILLLNIVGMGMLSSAYFNPLGGMAGPATSAPDLLVWMFNELFTEGAMRALFSILFGAGVVMFTQTRTGALHFRRTFWLLCFGLFDAYVLLWTGDILVAYAVGGALLYFARHASPKRLLIGAAVLVALLGLIRFASVYGLTELQTVYPEYVAMQAEGEKLDEDQQANLDGWLDFKAGGLMSEQQQLEELTARRSSFASVFVWSMEYFNEVLRFTLPVFMLWDALAMMLLGMALYKQGVLQGTHAREFYGRLAVVGITAGLFVNAFELWRSVSSDFDLVTSFSFIQPTYDLGRAALALGYIGLVIWCCKGGVLAGLLARLGAVGRMALTNYLMHSAIALVLFTGGGFALVGTLDRWMLYPIVLVIWLFQLWFSPWWLAKHAQGPLEALWRRLTYGRALHKPG